MMPNLAHSMEHWKLGKRLHQMNLFSQCFTPFVATTQFRSRKPTLIFNANSISIRVWRSRYYVITTDLPPVWTNTLVRSANNVARTCFPKPFQIFSKSFNFLFWVHRQHPTPVKRWPSSKTGLSGHLACQASQPFIAEIEIDTTKIYRTCF